MHSVVSYCEGFKASTAVRGILRVHSRAVICRDVRFAGAYQAPRRGLSDGAESLLDMAAWTITSVTVLHTTTQRSC